MPYKSVKFFRALEPKGDAVDFGFEVAYFILVELYLFFLG